MRYVCPMCKNDGRGDYKLYAMYSSYPSWEVVGWTPNGVPVEGEEHTSPPQFQDYHCEQCGDNFLSPEGIPESVEEFEARVLKIGKEIASAEWNLDTDRGWTASKVTELQRLRRALEEAQSGEEA